MHGLSDHLGGQGACRRDAPLEVGRRNTACFCGNHPCRFLREHHPGIGHKKPPDTVRHVCRKADQGPAIVGADRPFRRIDIHLRCGGKRMAGRPEPVEEVVKRMRLENGGGGFPVYHGVADRPHPCIRAGEGGDVQDHLEVPGRCRNHEAHQYHDHESDHDKCVTIAPGKQAGSHLFKGDVSHRHHRESAPSHG